MSNKSSALTGRRGEQHVQAVLYDKGIFTKMQQQRVVFSKTGQPIYPDPQGCDLIGNVRGTGRAVYIEVKTYNFVNGIPISANSGIKLTQLSFMLARFDERAISLFAFVDGTDVYFVNPEKVLKRQTKRYMLEMAKDDQENIDKLKLET